jgi:hypothetical protein
MGEVQTFQRRERRIAKARVADASQIRLEIDDRLASVAFKRICHECDPGAFGLVFYYSILQASSKSSRGLRG